MSNPFRIRWLRGWTFQIVFMEGKVQVEAQGFGICLRTALNPGESPTAAADRLVLAEDRRRRALHQAWIKAVRRGADRMLSQGLVSSLAPSQLRQAANAQMHLWRRRSLRRAA